MAEGTTLEEYCGIAATKDERYDELCGEPVSTTAVIGIVIALVILLFGIILLFRRIRSTKKES